MNLLDLQDRVVLITGGCGAIGRVIVRELVAHNARVAVNDIIPPGEAATILGEADPARQRSAYFPANASQPAEIAVLFDRVEAHWGLPDPAAVEGTEDEIHLAFADTYRMLEHRISRLVNLPLESLDRLGLQKQFDAIGNADTNTENP